MTSSEKKLNLLVAYPYANSRVFDELKKAEHKIRFLLDSGAFTAWKAGKEISLDDYCSFLEKIPVKAPSSVWVTLSPKANMNMPLLDQPFERADEIKMPIGKEADVQTLLSLLDKTAKRGALVWLQPLSQNQKATKVCIKAALDYGFRVSAQVHKFIGVE